MYVIIANLNSVCVSLFPFNTQDKIYRLLEVPLEKTLNIKQHELRQESKVFAASFTCPALVGHQRHSEKDTKEHSGPGFKHMRN